jgi:hypothetical protein
MNDIRELESASTLLAAILRSLAQTLKQGWREDYCLLIFIPANGSSKDLLTSYFDMKNYQIFISKPTNVSCS